MGDYNRSTKELAIDNLPSEAKAAIEKHLEQFNLGPLLKDAYFCIETRSEKIKKGIFSGPLPKLMISIAILAPRWLIQVLQSDSQPAYANSVQLRDLAISDYGKNPMYSKLPDNGLEVTGMYTSSIESGTRFIGLGKEEAGEKFKSMLIDAVQKAKM